MPTMIRKAGTAISSLFQEILARLDAISTPTMIRAGAVTVVVTTLKSGLKNIESRKKIPTQTAVKPDRPPAAIPDEDST